MTAVVATATGCRIRVRAQPRASRTELAGTYADAVRVRIAAPPVDGAANEELLRFLAERLGVPVRQLALAAGTTGRNKFVAVEGLSAGEAMRRLGLT